ncbi:Mu transposase C-terminal domain-containing protein [Delftia acidovorans]|uniref:Mu transposase C-terminal domain-containing protein n=1 Tax=Delftia acidovorans TaxID=80866 RepID=UPI003016761E
MTNRKIQEHDDGPQSVVIRRRRIDVSSGVLVRHDTGVFRIAEVLDFNTVTATSVQTGRTSVLLISDLEHVDQDPQPVSDIDINAITETDWRVAQTRMAAIEPLLKTKSPTRAAVEARAQELGVGTATLYRWIGRYRSLDAVSALVPLKRGWQHGKSRISRSAQSIIDEVINTYYLTPERPTAQKVVREVQRICLNSGVDAPSATAVRQRIDRIPERERLRMRGQRERAKTKFMPTPGTTPGGDYPLAIYQIDHTPLDVIVVDDEHRKPIGRPWLTIAIDEYSRMVAGYFMSFDAPSITSVGMCLANALVPKDMWLLKHGIDAEWPIWGRPKKVRWDNGPDFRSDSVRDACNLYNIDVEFRPVKVPRYGGYIERLQGSLLRELHDLPGTTFSSVEQRQEYDSEGRAVFTKSELENQLLRIICNEYHRREHRSLGMPPLRQFELGIFGHGGNPGTGMPPRPTDYMSIYIDFLPTIWRTVQNDGVEIDKRYYADVLRPWIGAIDPGTGKGLKHPFRRDPRDISAIWFFDPDLKEYFKIPLADPSFPSCSIWELQLAKQQVKAAGFDPSDSKAVLRSITERRELTKESAARTKQARRAAQRQAEHQRIAEEGPAPMQPPLSAARGDRDLAQRPPSPSMRSPMTQLPSSLVQDVVRGSDIA